MTLPDKTLRVKKSLIPGAGKGLFTKQFIPKGTLITEYLGKVQTWKQVEYEHGNDYIFYINSRHVINGKPALDTFGRYANDAEGKKKIGGLRNNSRYHTIGKRVFIQSVKDIPAGEEIFVGYGKDYWKQEKINREIEAEKIAKQ